MDSQLPGTVIFLLFIVLDAVIFGFGSAIQNVSDTELARKMEEGDEKAARILRIMNRPGKFINSLQLISVLLGLFGGAVVLQQLRRALAESMGGAVGTRLSDPLATGLSMMMAAVLLISFGVVLPKRLARRSPEKWAYACITPVNFLMGLVTPLRLPVQWISALFLRLAGIDPDSA